MTNSDNLLKWKLQNEDRFISINSFILKGDKPYFTDIKHNLSLKIEFDFSFLKHKNKINLLSYQKFIQNLQTINYYMAAITSYSSITNISNVNHIIKVFNDLKQIDNSATYKIIQPCSLLKEKNSNDHFILLSINNRITAGYLHNILCTTDLWFSFINNNKQFFTQELLNAI